MVGLITINKVALNMGIRSRTLRYWEAMGLFTSVRDSQSGWRTYDDHTLQCIRITDLLRKLDFSIRDTKL
jgi:DNA-binding transcriptional MerR regulator